VDRTSSTRARPSRSPSDRVASAASSTLSASRSTSVARSRPSRPSRSTPTRPRTSTSRPRPRSSRPVSRSSTCSPRTPVEARLVSSAVPVSARLSSFRSSSTTSPRPTVVTRSSPVSASVPVRVTVSLPLQTFGRLVGAAQTDARALSRLVPRDDRDWCHPARERQLEVRSRVRPDERAPWCPCPCRSHWVRPFSLSSVLA
jgi:hypothetical protein